MYQKEGKSLDQQHYFKMLPQAKGSCAYGLEAVHCLAVCDEPVKGTETTQPMLYSGDGGGVVKQTAKVTTKVL